MYFQWRLFCWQSLSGHTTTIEAVRFGHAEEMVVAGSQSGALKVWDLEQAKSEYHFHTQDAASIGTPGIITYILMCYVCNDKTPTSSAVW